MARAIILILAISWLAAGSLPFDDERAGTAWRNLRGQNRLFVGHVNIYEIDLTTGNAGAEPVLRLVGNIRGTARGDALIYSDAQWAGDTGGIKMSTIGSPQQEAKELTRGETDICPALSWSAKKLAFIRDHALWVKDLETDKLTRIGYAPEWQAGASPVYAVRYWCECAWTAGDERILCVWRKPDKPWIPSELRDVDPSGKRGFRRLASGVYDIAVNPKDGSVALARVVGFRDEKWSIWLAGYNPRAGLTGLHELADDAILPTWSPDGRFLAYMQQRPGSYVTDPVQLWIYDAATQEKHLIADKIDSGEIAWAMR
jgi:hypothetical protein